MRRMTRSVNTQGENAMALNSTSDDAYGLKSLDHDSAHVHLSDIHRFLHHKEAMTFTVNKLVGSDPSVGAAQTDPNLLNPWGVSESPNQPVLDFRQRLRVSQHLQRDVGRRDDERHPADHHRGASGADAGHGQSDRAGFQHLPV
jgi:hypothetical protein